jgi:hypothetical protein
MARMCAFCPADAVEKGGEHIWDDWLNKTQPKGARYKAGKRFGMNAPFIEYDTASLNEKLPVVCEPCNSGWMSGLTNKFKHKFSGAVLNGEPFTLDRKDAALLAAFTFMKAVVTDHAAIGDTFFARGDRERLRTSMIVPPRARCWFAAYQGDRRFSTKSNVFVVQGDVPPLLGMEFFSHSYVVGKLALQLLAPRWKDIRDFGRSLYTLTPADVWLPAVVSFWPYAGSSLSWPPLQHIADDTIQSFIYRFENPVRVPA